MNYYNLYREAVEIVRRGLPLSIVFVPNAWVDQFRAEVDAMPNRMVVPNRIDFINDLTQFAVHYHTSM